MAQRETNPPEVRIAFGGVSASVFLNEVRRADGSTFNVRKTVLQRTYVDAHGNYQTTASLDVHDLPKAILALSKAYEHCLSARQREAGETEDDG
jgi:hypothetical protein